MLSEAELKIAMKRLKARKSRSAAINRVRVSREHGMTDEHIVREARNIFGNRKPDFVKVVERVVNRT